MQTTIVGKLGIFVSALIGLGFVKLCIAEDQNLNYPFGQIFTTPVERHELDRFRMSSADQSEVVRLQEAVEVDVAVPKGANRCHPG